MTLSRLNERVLYQTRGFAWARNAERRREAFALLNDAGWVERAPSEGPRKPRGDWLVNPRIWETE